MVSTLREYSGLKKAGLPDRIKQKKNKKEVKRPRKVFYPAHWVWEEKQPFSLTEVDTKDILNKGTLGTKRWHHILEYGLLRYQWTFCEARERGDCAMAKGLG